MSIPVRNTIRPSSPTDQRFPKEAHYHSETLQDKNLYLQAAGISLIVTVSISGEHLAAASEPKSLGIEEVVYV